MGYRHQSWGGGEGDPGCELVRWVAGYVAVLCVVRCGVLYGPTTCSSAVAGVRGEPSAVWRRRVVCSAVENEKDEKVGPINLQSVGMKSIGNALYQWLASHDNDGKKVTDSAVTVKEQDEKKGEKDGGKGLSDLIESAQAQLTNGFDAEKLFSSQFLTAFKNYGAEAEKLKRVVAGEGLESPEENMRRIQAFFDGTLGDENDKTRDDQRIQAFLSASLLTRLPNMFLKKEEENHPEKKGSFMEFSEDEMLSAVNAEITELLGLPSAEKTAAGDEGSGTAAKKAGGSNTVSLPDRFHPTFRLPDAISLAGFAFEAYNTPRSGMKVQGTDGNNYYLTSVDLASSIFSGLVILSMRKLELQLGPLGKVSSPFVRVAVGKAIREDPALDETMHFYLDRMPSSDGVDGVGEHVSNDVTVELWSRFPEQKRVGWATLKPSTLGKDGDSKKVRVAIRDERQHESPEETQVLAQVELEGSYFSLQEEEEKTVAEETAAEEQKDCKEDDQSYTSESPSAFGKVELLYAVPQLQGLSSRQWGRVADFAEQSMKGFHKMERLVYIKNVETDTELCIWRKEKHIVVAFCGTEQTSWKDLLTDSMAFQTRFEPGCPQSEIDLNLQTIISPHHERAENSFVHYGFLRAYASVRQGVLDKIDFLTEGGSSKYHVFMTGHSLGGALATLLGSDLGTLYPNLKLTMYNFGSPKVGNSVFVEKFNSVVPDSVRLVNNSDIIARMPRREWDFCHAGHCAVVREDGMLWVDDGTEEHRLKLGMDSVNDIVKKEMSNLEGLIRNSPSTLNDHMEDSYFLSLVNAQLKITNGENTTFAA